MAARTGKQYIEGLRDDRTVWLGNEKVDVLSNPAFAGSLEGMAGYFDWQNKHAADCLVPDPVSGKPMSASLIVPKTADDLQRRHKAFDCFSRYSGRHARPNAGLCERHAGRLCRPHRHLQRQGRHSLRRPASALLPRGRRKGPLADPHHHSPGRRQGAARHARASTASWRSKLSAGTRTASSCAAPRSWPRLGRSPTNCSSIPVSHSRRMSIPTRSWRSRSRWEQRADHAVP